MLIMLSLSMNYNGQTLKFELSRNQSHIHVAMDDLDTIK